jgi:uncharacterized NAD(P)/FAD-binding protein YdhS
MGWICRQYARLFGAQERVTRVVVCGGGASAVLFAQALAKRVTSPVELTIVERRAQAGPGLAYGASSEAHLLNVPAAGMGIDQDDPDHFLRWLGAKSRSRQGGYRAGDFVSRRLYGDYLRDVLGQLLAQTNGLFRASVIRATVCGARERGREWRVDLSDGGTLRADVVVLATGNEPPAPIAGEAPASVRKFIIDDPWDAEAREIIWKNDKVLLLGAGLTAIDMAIEMLEKGHRGSMICASRHALLPHTHNAPADPLHMAAPLPKALGDIVARFRDVAGCAEGEQGWQRALDALRPSIPDIWKSLPLAEQRRFLRHLRSYWNAHRHRVAPEIGSQILRAVARGRLHLVRGRVHRLREGNGEGHILVTLKSGAVQRELLADCIINCTGPCEDIARVKNQLLVDLLKRGSVRPDPLRLGIDVDDDSRAVARDGRVQGRLFALGGLTKGRWWEITSIPEIRAQAERVASLVASPSTSAPHAAMAH